MPNLRSHRFTFQSLQTGLAGIILPGAGTADLQLRGFLVASFTSLLVIGLAFGCYLEGALPRDALIRITLAIVVAVLGFYVIFRSGLNRAAADPSLTVPQMAVATLVMMYAMYSAEGGAGGVFPVIVLMIFLFGVIRLRTKGLLRFALFVLAAYAATIALRAYLHPPLSDAGVRWLQWTMLALALPWFALMGGHLKGLRERLGKSNDLLRTAMEAAQASETRLAEAQRIARLGSWTYQPATKVAYWSPEMYRIYGVDAAKPVPLGSEFLPLIHPDDQRHYLDLVRPAIREGRAFDSEYRIASSDGGIRWVHVVGELVAGDDGSAVLLRGTATDVTERKAQESALQHARDEAAAARTMLLDAINVLPEAFALFDADDRLALWNGPYSNLFAQYANFKIGAGVKYADVVRASVANGEPIPPEYANDLDGYVADRVRLHRNPPENREVKVGSDRWLQVSEGHTTFGGIVGVRSDITERKQLEQRQAMEHAVTRHLAESDSVQQTMASVIRTICETLEWDFGARWQLNADDDTLRCVDFWHVFGREIEAFSAFRAQQTFTPGTSEPVGRSVLTGVPVWIADVSREPGFEQASAAGLRGAFAFPIRIGTRRVGAMEFFLRNARPPAPALLRVLDSIGLQLGQYIERAAAQEQLRKRAHYDDLTGLPNRSLFNELLARAFAKARRNGTRLAILFIDLDGFKAVNDRLGHDAGDHLLATFSKRLQNCLRKSDTIARRSESDTAARLGGDEFVVLVDDVSDTSELPGLARRILGAAAKPFDLAGQQGRVTASIGIGLFPDDGQDIDSLMKAADGAMYEAKQGGRNAYRFVADKTPADVALVA